MSDDDRIERRLDRLIALMEHIVLALRMVVMNVAVLVVLKACDV